MNVLITGSSGFIGTKLVNYLLMHNFNVTVLARSCNFKKVKFIKCDLLNDEIKISMFEGIDIVIHLAGIAHQKKYSKKIGETYIKLNSDITQEIAKCADKSGVKNFLFLSSVKAKYYDNNIENIEYSNSPKIDIYGFSKKHAERFLINYNFTNMKIFIIRSSLVYGPNVKGNLHLLKNYVESNFFVSLPKIYNKKSLIHVDDLVYAILKVLESGTSKRIYTATDGSYYSTTDLFDNIYFAYKKKTPKYRFPRWIVGILLYFQNNSNFLNKIFGDDHFSNHELTKIGFAPQKNLLQFYETDI